MLVDTSDEDCDSCLYSLECHSLEDMVEDIQRFGTLSVLNSRSYDYFKAQIK